MLFDEYRASLKMPEAEELLDLAFYRPLAFVLVQGIRRLPVTPNQVTGASMLAGLAAAWCFAGGTAAGAAWGACWYFLSNVFDCADGQLARVQRSGSPLGRVVDGVADYVASVAIFLGLGFGFAAAGESRWLLVAAGGLSSALHALFFDHYQNEFISTVRGEKNFLRREMEQFIGELNRLARERRNGPRRLLLRLYLRYLAVQRRMSTKLGEHDYPPERYRRESAAMIRGWSLLGPTTNRTLLILCAVAGRPDAFLWAVVAAGNAWLVVAFVLQQRIHRRLNAPEAG